MGEDALESQVEAVEDSVTDVVVETPESPEGSEGGEGSPEPQESESLEIVRRSDQGSQPKAKKPPGKGLRKAFNRLTLQREAAKGEAAEKSNELIIEQEKTKLLTLALEQAKSEKSSKLPNPEDFDDGVNDPGYRQAYQTHTDALIDAKVSAAMNKSAGNFTATQDKAAQNTKLNQSIDKHFDRAELLGAKDYAEVEAKAIDILGIDNVNHLISSSENAHLVLYYLGKPKNHAEAEEYAALLNTEPVRALLQIGVLGNELEIKPKGNLNPAPNPDEELEGGSPSAGNSNLSKYERDLDKMITLISEGKKTMTDLVEFKKKAKSDGAIS